MTVFQLYFRRSCGKKAVVPHSSALAWKIPWTEEPGRLQSMGSPRVQHYWATSLSLFTFMHWRRKWQPTPVFLPGESQGRESLVGCRLWGRTESDNWSDLAAAATAVVKHWLGELVLNEWKQDAAQSFMPPYVPSWECFLIWRLWFKYMKKFSHTQAREKTIIRVHNQLSLPPVLNSGRNHRLNQVITINNFWEINNGRTVKG